MIGIESKSSSAKRAEWSSNDMLKGMCRDDKSEMMQT